MQQINAMLQQQRWSQDTIFRGQGVETKDKKKFPGQGESEAEAESETDFAIFWMERSWSVVYF